MNKKIILKEFQEFLKENNKSSLRFLLGWLLLIDLSFLREDVREEEVFIYPIY